MSRGGRSQAPILSISRSGCVCGGDSRQKARLKFECRRGSHGVNLNHLGRERGRGRIFRSRDPDLLTNMHPRSLQDLQNRSTIAGVPHLMHKQRFQPIHATIDNKKQVNRTVKGKGMMRFRLLTQVRIQILHPAVEDAHVHSHPRCALP